MPAKKRAKIAQHTLRKALPHLTALSEDIDAQTERRITKAYSDKSIRPNRFAYASAIIATDGLHPTLRLLKDAGAFASHAGRQALIELVDEARRVQGDGETLDTLERYARCAFSLEDDSVTIGCGNIDE